MGADVSAVIFYGYKYPVDIHEDEECFNDDLDVVWCEDYTYLAAADSCIYTDDDYNPKQLFPQQMYMCENRDRYYQLIKNWLNEKQIAFKSEDIGWFIVCDYS